MRENRFDNEKNSNSQTRVSDIFTSAALGVFALAVIWFASSLLIHLVK